MVIGILASAAETRDLADQVNRIGPMDAVIHNAGVYLEPSRAATGEGHARTLAVNTLAPYLLTALIGRPARRSTSAADCITMVPGRWPISTGPGGRGTPPEPTAERELAVTALALALARAWPDVSATPSIRAGCRPRWAAPQ